MSKIFLGEIKSSFAAIIALTYVEFLAVLTKPAKICWNFCTSQAEQCHAGSVVLFVAFKPSLRFWLVEEVDSSFKQYSLDERGLQFVELAWPY